MTVCECELLPARNIWKYYTNLFFYDLTNEGSRSFTQNTLILSNKREQKYKLGDFAWNFEINVGMLSVFIGLNLLFKLNVKTIFTVRGNNRSFL